MAVIIDVAAFGITDRPIFLRWQDAIAIEDLNATREHGLPENIEARRLSRKCFERLEGLHLPPSGNAVSDWCDQWLRGRRDARNRREPPSQGSRNAGIVQSVDERMPDVHAQSVDEENERARLDHGRMRPGSVADRLQ